MKKTLIYLAIGFVLAACRGGSSGSLQRKDQQNYDVVQEGQASGVTSTINAPGEVAPPVAMTGTNADTTSNFTLPGSMSTDTSSQPGTLAGSMQIPGSAGSATAYPSNPRPPRPRVEPPPKRVEPEHTEPAPPPPATSTSLEGPPPTSTTPTEPRTETQPPPTDKRPPSTGTQAPPSTDTQPPPTTTTT